MYRAILDKLPIHWFFKLILVIIILVGVTAFCFEIFFPWIYNYLPFPIGSVGFEEV